MKDEGKTQFEKVEEKKLSMKKTSHLPPLPHLAPEGDRRS